MFTIECPTHQATVLLGPRRIQRLENTDDGIVVHWRCYCGTTGSHVTGSRAAERAPSAAA